MIELSFSFYRRSDIKMHCTYNSLFQIKIFKEQNVLKNSFSCENMEEIDNADKLTKKVTMEKYFGEYTKCRDRGLAQGQIISHCVT